ncbi:MAG: hypothetical protein AB7G37_12175 [Solirubrobacteraceae bacterium]
MESLITIVVFAVVGVSALVAIGTIFVGGDPHKRIGADGVDPGGRAPGPDFSGDETPEMQEADARGMIEGRNRRRIARGQEPLDVDAELARVRALTGPPSVDPEAEAEARAIVAGRNARRRRRGEPEGDVEAEVAALLDVVSRMKPPQ